MNRSIREIATSFTQGEADTFTPSISPEAMPYIISSVVPPSELAPSSTLLLPDDTDTPAPRAIRRYYINQPDGKLQIYEGACLYPYHGITTMFAHVEVVFEEVPIPHESVLKWCALALKAGPASTKARDNQLIVAEGNTLHYLWRVLSLDAEASLAGTRAPLDITGLHLWRWHPLESGELLGDYGKWVCGRVSLSIEPKVVGPHNIVATEHVLTTSRGTRPIPWDAYTSHVPDHEPVHKLYMALMGEGLV
jgi:hypothetical protein